MDRTMKVTRGLGRGPQQAPKWTKRSLNNWLRMFGPAFDASLGFEMLGFFSVDLKEGVDAIQQSVVRCSQAPRADPIP
jgi:enoyl-CoA hydratase